MTSGRRWLVERLRGVMRVCGNMGWRLGVLKCACDQKQCGWSVTKKTHERSTCSVSSLAWQNAHVTKKQCGWARDKKDLRALDVFGELFELEEVSLGSERNRTPGGIRRGISLGISRGISRGISIARWLVSPNLPSHLAPHLPPNLADVVEETPPMD